MIRRNNRNIIDIHNGSKGIVAVYIGRRLVWNKITEQLSCFSNGHWNDECPWTDDLSIL